MNTKYSLRLLTVLILGLSAAMPSHAAENKNAPFTNAFSYQVHTDSNKNSHFESCTSESCGPEISFAGGKELLADNSGKNHIQKAEASGPVQTAPTPEDEESVNTLFGFALGDISTKNLAVAFFCFMTGVLFLLFGLKGW